MPHIKTITTTGLRATDRSVDLGPLTLVRGPVGSGKTAIADAIRIAVIGYVPSIGKSEASTARLMRDSALNVSIALDDGTSCERGYARVGRSVTGTASASWMPPRAKPSEITEAIRSLVGRDDREAAEHLDIRALLSASAAERARRIEELLDASGIPAAELVTRAVSMLTLRLAAVEPDRMPADLDALRAAAKGAVALVPETHRPALTFVAKNLASYIGDTGAAKAIDACREQKKQAAEGLRTKIAARAEIEDKVRDLRAPAEALADVERRREEALGRKAAATRDLAEAERIAGIRAQTEPALPGLRADAEEKEQALAAAVVELAVAKVRDAEREAILDPDAPVAPPVVAPDAEQIAAAVALLDEARTLPEPLPVPPNPADIARAEALETEACKARKAAEAVTLPEEISDAEERAAVKAAERARALADQSPWRRVEEIVDGLDPLAETLDHVGQGTLAPELRSAQTALRDLAVTYGGDAQAAALAVEQANEALDARRKLVAERKAAIAEATARRDSLRAKDRDLLAQAETIRKLAGDEARASTEEQRRAWQTRVTALRDRAERIRKDAEDVAKAANDANRERYGEALADWQAECADRKARRDELRQQAEAIRAAAVDAQSARDRAAAALAEAEARLAGIAAATADPEAARASLAAAGTEIADCDRALVALRGADALRREMADLLAGIDRATAERDCWTAAEWSCQRLRELDLAARAKGLEERMRRYLRAAGRTEDPYLRAARGVCDFGWRRKGHEISVEALSGGETALFCAALAGAIVALRRPPLRILLVEGAEVGVGPEAQQLLDLCAAMVGDLDQVLLTTCNPVEALPPWTVVDLGVGVEAEAVR